MSNLYIPFSDSELLIGTRGLFTNERIFRKKVNSSTDFRIGTESLVIHFLFYLDLREISSEGIIIPINDLSLLHEIEAEYVARYLGWAIQEAQKLFFFPRRYIPSHHSIVSHRGLKKERWELIKPIYGYRQITYQEMLTIRHVQRVGLLIYRDESDSPNGYRGDEYLLGFKGSHGEGLTDFGGGSRSYERPLETMRREFREEFGFPLENFPEINLRNSSIYLLNNAEGFYIEFFCSVSDFNPFIERFRPTKEIKGLIVVDSFSDYDLLDGSLRYVLRGLGLVP